jgi:hypothetical protein
MAMPATAAPPVSDQPMANDAATAMAQDMPCCPTQAPVSNCGGDCLLMAVCVTQLLCNAVPGAGLVIPLGLLSVFIPGNDTDTAGLSQGPPPRPPDL